MNSWKIIVAALACIMVIASCATETGDTEKPSAPGEADIGEIGGMCGGIAGFQCNGEDAYCAYEAGICREVADAAGVCTVKPQVCTMDYRPVCGCDDVTYSNACAAAGAGVSVAYEGACGEEVTVSR